MKQQCSSIGLRNEGPVNHSFALRSFQPLLIVKSQKKKQRNISLNPILEKGPPGADQSPGRRISSFNNHSFNTNLFTTMKIKSFNHINTIHSITLKIQLPMKKQILFFAFLVLVLIANVDISYGQAVAGSAPQPIACAATADAYHPIAGVPYDYSAGISPTGGIPYWFATTSTTFITDGAIVATEEAIGGTYVAAATGYQGTATQATSPTTTNITWTTGGIAAATVLPTEPPRLFLALNYSGTDCANNFKVYPIRPINAFVVDIKNMTAGATQTTLPYGELESQCFDIVRSAVYTPGVDGDINYDFGTQYLYYEVVAANFTGSYTPTFRLGGLGADQTADIDWGTAIGTYGTNVTSGSGNGDYASTAVSTTVANTSTGVSIYVRVTIHNNDFQGTALTPITLAVEAVNSATQPDVDNTDCTLNTAFIDVATQNLDPRPDVQSVAPNTFLPIGNY